MKSATRRNLRDRFARFPPAIHTVRVIECAELIAADLFAHADQNRARITFGDVERHLAQSASHSQECDCGRCVLVSRVSAQRVYQIASGWQRQVRQTRVRDWS